MAADSVSRSCVIMLLVTVESYIKLLTVTSQSSHSHRQPSVLVLSQLIALSSTHAV